MVTAGIQAGSSIENAFLDVEREIGVLTDKIARWDRSLH